MPSHNSSIWSQHELNTIIFEVVFSSFLSLFGSLYIIKSYLSRNTKRMSIWDSHHRLVFYLSLADTGNSIAFIYGALSRPTNFMCPVQAALNQFFALSAAIWTSIIAWSLVEVARQVSHSQNAETTNMGFLKEQIIGYLDKQFPKYHIISWGIPMFSAIYLIASDTFGRTNLWCWIDTRHEAMRFFFYIGPVLFICLFNACSFFYAHKVVKHAAKNRVSFSSNQDELIMVRALSLYVMAGVLCWSWGIANRIVEYQYRDTQKAYDIKWLFYIQAFADPSQGLVNALVYAYYSRYIYKYDNASRNRFNRFVHKYVYRDNSYPTLNSRSETVTSWNTDSIPSNETNDLDPSNIVVSYSAESQPFNTDDESFLNSKDNSIYSSSAVYNSVDIYNPSPVPSQRAPSTSINFDDSHYDVHSPGKNVLSHQYDSVTYGSTDLNEIGDSFYN